eukprot:COSAG06_NODE_530_length_14570_cov_23.269435_9_plen_52_part_00
MNTTEHDRKKTQNGDTQQKAHLLALSATHCLLPTRITSVSLVGTHCPACWV